MKLTKKAIDALTYDPNGPMQQVHFADSGPPGFGVRVFPSKVKSFVLWYRTATGRKRLYTIGRFGVLTLEQAEAKARALLVEANDGGDPAGERRKARRDPTVKDLAEDFIERHAKPNKKSWEADQRMLARHVLPQLGARKLAEITRAEISLLHHRIGKTAPIEANRVLALLHTMFSKAEEWGLVEEGKANPAKMKRGQKFKEKKRDRWVTEAELPVLVDAIDAEPAVYRAAFKLYLLTAFRRAELLNLRWRDVDFNRREIRLPDTKAGRPHVVTLTDEMEEVLRTLPRGIGNAPVFPGEDPKKALVGIGKAWRRVRTRYWLAQNPDRAAELRHLAEEQVARRSKHAEKTPAIVEAVLLQLANEPARLEADLRLHDLRRTVGSWLAMSGASLPLIGKVLNHSNASTTQIYARLTEDAAAEALERHSAKIGPMLGITAVCNES